MIFLLDENDLSFPAPELIPEDEREPDGLLAVGGDLRAERLIEAYSQGIFPWSDFRQPYLLWYCPQQRFVIFPRKVHISHSMRTLINKGQYRLTFDQDFEAVINNCSKLRIDCEGAWLGPQMIAAYTELYRRGYAHSVEVWRGDDLVGGLYGVSMLNGFMGESMFSLVPSASKLALIYLCQKLEAEGASFVDCQFHTPHLESMGGEYIPYDTYMELLWNDK